MGEAGLTHGGFYAHFVDKDALVTAAVEAAMAEGRAAWTDGLETLSPEQAYRRIVGRYLSGSHRDAPERGCPMAALAGELARRSPEGRKRFEEALGATLAALLPHMPDDDPDRRQARMIATVALCLGGLLLSRMVAEPGPSDEILRACRRWLVADLGDSNELPPHRPSR